MVKVHCIECCRNFTYPQYPAPLLCVNCEVVNRNKGDYSNV